MTARRLSAYDLEKVQALDREDRRYDEPCDDLGCSWDEIIATTQDDFLAGRFAFNSADYATEAEAMVAMQKFMDEVLEEVLNEAASVCAQVAAS